MSRIKRFIENEVARISEKSGYSEDFLMGVLEEMQEDGETDLEENLNELEAVAMEHDF